MAESTLESATIDQLVFKLALAIGGYPENKDKKPIIDLATSLDNSKVHGKKQKTKDELIVLLGYETNGYEISGSFQTISDAILYLTDIGVKDIDEVVARQPRVLMYDVEKKMKPTVEYLKSIGIKKKDIGKVVAKLPAILGYDVESNLKPKYEFLKQNFNVSAEDIVVAPALLGYSLENRIKPRYEFLKSKGLESKYKAWSVLAPRDEKFSKRLKVPLQEYLDFKDNYLQQQKQFLQKGDALGLDSKKY